MQPSYATFRPYPEPGEVLDGKYRLERILGEGGMGAVAKATHLLRKAPVALKFMSASVVAMPGAVERFVNEGVAASRIDSEHVVKIFDVCRLPSGAPYLVMEYLEGFDLGDVLARDGRRLPTPRAIHFALQMLRGLHTAHAAGIVHRDVKPSNCFVIDREGEPDFVKLVDFGISKVRSADDGRGQTVPLTRTNSALGTPLYMSPEQARSPRDVDHRTDLYSVGAILYETLAGHTPYIAESGEFTEILFKIFTTDPEPLPALRPDLPEGLTAAVQRALSRDRDVRFASAVEMAESLTPFADERSAALVSRLRSRGRSWLPPAAVAPSITPPASDARASQHEVHAQTYVAAADGTAPKRLETGVGLAREQDEGAPAGSAKTNARRSALLVGGAFALAAAGTLAGVVAMRGPSSAPAAAGFVSPPSQSTAPPRPEAPPSAGPVEPPARASAEALSPAPSAALADAGASPPRRAEEPPRPSAHGSASAPPPVAPLPRELGDLKLH